MELACDTLPLHPHAMTAGSFSKALRQNAGMDVPIATPPEPDADPGVRLAALYGELRKPLLAFLRKHTGDAQVAEDLLHDVVLKALAAGRDADNSPRNLTGWLYAVARNAAMDHHRRTRPTEELPEDLRAPAADEEELAVAELSNCLRPVAERLPETYRETLIAAEFEGQPLAEVARAQGISLSAVKTRASRGRRLLQQQLVECCRVALSAHGEVLDYDTTRAKRPGARRRHPPVAPGANPRLERQAPRPSSLECPQCGRQFWSVDCRWRPGAGIRQSKSRAAKRAPREADGD